MSGNGDNEKRDRNDDPLWYRDAVIYEIHVRAYADSDGDGRGDFQGLTSKLDYLRDLGVTSIRNLVTGSRSYVGLSGFGIEIAGSEPV